MTTNWSAKKKRTLRHNEYYDMQEVFDQLYDDSKQGKNFNNLIELITDERNILLAYRNIKANKGSKTPGVNKTNIMDIAEKSPEKLIEYIRRRFENYMPHKVRRKEIPKDNGKVRPLGIPTIEDRLIQQCIKQILEPICEAKFYKYSFGFRPNRSTKHAISRCMQLMQVNNLHYVVDVDIKGFFDNVDHGKLLKQMWGIGIRDKQVICVISKMLKAPIIGEGIPTKGTPQGGILSPLLANIVLNELDWWVSSQWDTFKALNKKGEDYKSDRARLKALKDNNAKLKEMYLVRYADDFKIFCRTAKEAQKMYVAVKNWLKERLGLEISPEKSKVVNLRKNYTDYLGYTLKVVKEEKKDKRTMKDGKPRTRSNWKVRSLIKDKSVEKIIRNVKEQIQVIKYSPDVNEVNKLNSMILGYHLYFQHTTEASKCFRRINWKLRINMYNQLNEHMADDGFTPKVIERLYGDCKAKPTFIKGIRIIPLHYQSFQVPISFSPETCDYTKEGRRFIHEKLKKVKSDILRYIMRNPVPGETVEYNDNRISLYVAQNGRCKVTEKVLDITNMECHHKKPRKLGGDDKYSNLVLVTKEVHKLIHATNMDTIIKYLQLINPDNAQLRELNKLRSKAKMEEIKSDWRLTIPVAS